MQHKARKSAIYINLHTTDVVYERHLLACPRMPLMRLGLQRTDLPCLPSIQITRWAIPVVDPQGQSIGLHKAVGNDERSVPI